MRDDLGNHLWRFDWNRVGQRADGYRDR